ncbi:MAG TPA: hypothetical protein VEU51_08455 [Candidatus Acidoferrales bacterium]|nr:hypothetical protein [Candidatus Acidoferrales bacterium]
MDTSSRDPGKGYFSDEKFKALTKMVEHYHSEAEKCASARAYYAACIMIGAAFEALLLQALSMFSDEVAEAVRNLPRRPRGPIDHWNLDELIKVAIVLGWRPPRRGPDPVEAGIGELADLLRRLRNVSHAARHLREPDEAPLKVETYRAAYAIFDSARDWLSMKTNKGPRKKPSR